jgi:hypothetical protein
MATLRTAALNLLRLAGFCSIRTGLKAVMHDIKTLLAMARRQPESTHGSTVNQPCLFPQPPRLPPVVERDHVNAQHG